MMYMEDAIRATLELMNAPSEKVKIRSSYNLSGANFTPKEVADEIIKHQPDFKISYAPDFRQEIADTWPGSVDDSAARADWGWEGAHADLWNLLAAEQRPRVSLVSVSWVMGHDEQIDVDSGMSTYEDKAGHGGADKLVVAGADLYEGPVRSGNVSA